MQEKWNFTNGSVCATIKKVALPFPPNLKSENDKYSICQVICGTDPYPKNFRAKKYKIKEKFFTKADFQLMMRNLPVPVNEDDIDAMFDFADKDRDGKINYRYFKFPQKSQPQNLFSKFAVLNIFLNFILYSLNVWLW